MINKHHIVPKSPIVVEIQSGKYQGKKILIPEPIVNKRWAVGEWAKSLALDRVENQTIEPPEVAQWLENMLGKNR